MRRSLVGLGLLLAGLSPLPASAGIILIDAYRAVDAGIGIHYTPTNLFGQPLDPVTAVADPEAKTTTAFGDWSESVYASVRRSNVFGYTTYSASATQDSTIAVDASADRLTGSGEVTVHADDPSIAYGIYDTSARFRLNFEIDSGSYAYSFGVVRPDVFFPSVSYPVNSGFTWSGDFSPNSAGIIGPGSYALSIRFLDTGERTINVGIPFTLLTSDTFNFVVEPSVEPPPGPVPEPATLLLVGSGLAGLALGGRRRVPKS